VSLTLITVGMDPVCCELVYKNIQVEDSGSCLCRGVIMSDVAVEYVVCIL
jgi:hypothetical protein